METIYCSSCYRKRPVSSFLNDASADPESKVYATCIPCQASSAKANKKRKALQELDPNVPPKRPRLLPPPPPPNPRLELHIPTPNSPETRPETQTYKPAPPPL
jgi:hypothetical protein